MGPADVHACLRLAVTHLPDDGWDGWDRRLPGLRGTARHLLSHMASTPLWYALDLSADGEDLDGVTMEVDPKGEVAALRRTMVASVGMLARVLTAASPSARGFHPWGLADPEGFAAMACDELLVHTDDVVRATDHVFEPPEHLAKGVLHRLFPWAPDNDAPWLTLLWANGRTPLGHRGQLDGWRWHAAPLDEWDGHDPTRAWERDPV